MMESPSKAKDDANLERRSKSLCASTAVVCEVDSETEEAESVEDFAAEGPTTPEEAAHFFQTTEEESGGSDDVALSPDPVPRKRMPKELPNRLRALKERDRNASQCVEGNSPKSASKARLPRFDLAGSQDLLQSTDKLQDILQFLKRADTDIDEGQARAKQVQSQAQTTRRSSPGPSPPPHAVAIAESAGNVRLSSSSSILRISANLERVGESLVGLRAQRSRCDETASPERGEAVGILEEISGEHEEGAPSGQAEAISTVCTGVHNKIKGLHVRIQSQNEAMASLERQVEEGKKREKKLEEDFLQRITQALDKQGREHETSLKRHLNFIDRILKDKDVLSKKCEGLAGELKSLEEMYSSKIERLQQQWACELKKQKEVWHQAEKARREAWLSEKTREIKEMTIKGLEPEIQRLIQKSKADLEDQEQRHAQDTRKKVEECKDYYESYIHSLRDQWRRERDDLIEHERATASSRLREQGDRHDSQTESLRMRLVSDFESKLSSLETQKREEHTRSENALSRLRKEHDEEVAKLTKGFEERARERDREADAEKERMREKFETEREGWRQMIVKKIKEEFQAREEEARKAMESERNQELELIVTKLEHETHMAREACAEEFERRAREMREKHAEEVKELRESNQRFSDKYREAAQVSQTSKKEISSIQSLNKASARELEVKAETITFLETQLAACRREAAAKDKDVRAMYEDKCVILEQKAASYGERAETSERKLGEATEEIARLTLKGKTDMAEVEARVKEAITKRENIISHLQNELLSLQQNLEQTEGLLDH